MCSVLFYVQQIYGLFRNEPEGIIAVRIDCFNSRTATVLRIAARRDLG